MKKKYLIVLLVLLVIIPSLVFAYLDDDGGGNLEENNSFSSAMAQHEVKDIETTSKTPFKECESTVNHKGMTAFYGDGGRVEEIKICNTAVIASGSNTLRYSQRMTYLTSPQANKILMIRQDNEPEGYTPNTKVYFMTTIARADLERAFGNRLDTIDYIDSGAVIQSGYRDTNMKFTATKANDWGYLEYIPSYLPMVKDYTFYQNKLKQEPGFKVFSGEAPQDMLDMFARYKLERPIVNLIANTITSIGSSTTAKPGVEIGFTVDVDTLALHHLT